MVVITNHNEEMPQNDNALIRVRQNHNVIVALSKWAREGYTMQL